MNIFKNITIDVVLTGLFFATAVYIDLYTHLIFRYIHFILSVVNTKLIAIRYFMSNECVLCVIYFYTDCFTIKTNTVLLRLLITRFAETYLAPDTDFDHGYSDDGPALYVLSCTQISHAVVLSTRLSHR